MKQMILSSIILTAAIAFMIWASVFSCSKLDGIIEDIQELPDIPNEKTVDMLDDIEKTWNKHRELYSAITKYDFIYNFTKELHSAKSGIIADDPGTYLSSKKAMLNVLYYIRDLQKLRIDNIL